MENLMQYTNLVERILKLEKMCDQVKEGRFQNGILDTKFEMRLKIVEDSLKELINVKKEREKQNRTRSWQVWILIVTIILTSIAGVIVGKLV